MYQSGGGDGREARVGRDDGHHGGQDVRRGGLGGGEDVGATDACQAGRRRGHGSESTDRRKGGEETESVV
jgi:hypothetical protein